MDRRYFLQALALAGIGAYMPSAQSIVKDNTAKSSSPKHLVLIELSGGNDGLNTVIPYNDKTYYQLRPSIGIQRDHVWQLNEQLGLNPALNALQPLWSDKAMAVINGVGYPDPNRSHFRSIEIWETGSASDETLLDGWLTPITRKLPKRAASGIKAVALAEDLGPFAGSSDSTAVFTNLNRFIKQSKQLRQLQTQANNGALQHILEVQNATQKAGLDFAESIAQQAPLNGSFPKGVFASQLSTVAQLIHSHAGPQIYKISLKGFDTHVNQTTRHNGLLKQLGEGVFAFSQSMKSAGLWGDVLMMTYSEFGRRAAENGSKGTDHGTAAPQFLFGGKVHGGVYGQQPSLVHLTDKDLEYSIDFRSVYRTVTSDWLNVSEIPSSFRAFEKLGIVGK